MQMPMQVPQMNQGSIGCYQPVGMNQMQAQQVMMSTASQSFVPNNQNDKYENHVITDQRQQHGLPSQSLPHQPFAMGAGLKPPTQEHL